MKTMRKNAWFRWKCDGPRTIQSWGMTLERSRSFLDAPKPLRAQLPLLYRVLFGARPWFVRRAAEGYPVNRARDRYRRRTRPTSANSISAHG